MSRLQEKCKCCKQRLYTTSKLGKGNAKMMVAISKLLASDKYWDASEHTFEISNGRVINLNNV